MGIYFTQVEARRPPPVHRLWCGIAAGSAAYDLFEGNGVDADCLLNQAVEELAPAFRSSPLEAKGELVQVVVEVVEVFVAD